MSNNIKTKVISGLIWSSIQKFGTMSISFISNMVLARLLSPEDYGCLGMLAIFILISSTFINGGFGSALIQKKEPTNEDYSTIFYWNIFISFVFYLVLFFMAPFIAKFYKLPLLCNVLRVEGIILIINALIIVQENQFRKRLEFKKLTAIYLAASILSVIMAIVLAYAGLGVWALVAQQLLMNFFTALFLWIVNKWRPILIFSFKSFKELFSFGFFILFSDIINAISDNIQGLLIGRFYNASTMGYYTQAHKLDQVASSSISSIINQVSYPAFADVQSDNQRLIIMLQKFVTTLAYMTIPIMLLIILLAYPIILIVYSDKWLNSVSFLQILCIAGISNCLQGINYYAIAAKSLSSTLFKWSIPKRVVGIIFMILGLICAGIHGLLWGMVLSSFTIYFVNAYLVSKYIGYSMKKQVMDLFPIILIAIISFLGAFLLGFFIEQGLVVKTIIQIIIFTTLYIVLSKLFRLEVFVSTREIVYKYIYKSHDR